MSAKPQKQAPKQPIPSDGYSRAQLLLILESVTADMAALMGILSVAQVSQDEWTRAQLIDAAHALAQAIGCVTDDATGGSVVGDIGRWHCGPGFADAGSAT